MAMFEKFTDGARRVVVLAQDEATLLNHNYIGTEHLLLGLIRSGAGASAATLESAGISLGAAREQVREIIGPGSQPPFGHIPFTPRATRVLEGAEAEAVQWGHNQIEAGHLLLALVRENKGVGAQILVKLGADLNQLRQHVTELFGEP